MLRLVATPNYQSFVYGPTVRDAVISSIVAFEEKVSIIGQFDLAEDFLTISHAILDLQLDKKRLRVCTKTTNRDSWEQMLEDIRDNCAQFLELTKLSSSSDSILSEITADGFRRAILTLRSLGLFSTFGKVIFEDRGNLAKSAFTFALKPPTGMQLRRMFGMIVHSS
jgi:hypothetical protein